MNRFSEAMECLQKCLAIRQEIFPIYHPQIATTLDLCATCAFQQGDLQRAKRLCEESLRFLGSVYHSSHEDVVRVQYNLDVVNARLKYQSKGEAEHRWKCLVQ